MMSQQIMIKLFLIAACGYLWRLGGAAGFSKAWRRFGCPALVMVSVVMAKNWVGLFSLPLMIFALSLGYGESSTLQGFWEDIVEPWEGQKAKYLTRLTCGLAYSFAMLPILWGNWWLFGFHVCLVSVGVMLAGNQKFKYDDKREEVFIGLIFGLIPIL